MSGLRKHFAPRWVKAAVLLLALACWQTCTVHAQTITVYFYAISTHLSEENIATGERQLRLDVTHHEDDIEATFKFYNSGGSQECSITDIYIDDGHLATLEYLVNGPGVSFSIGASPGNLPDGQLADPPFVTTKQFNMDGDPPPYTNGINPGEQLEAVYSVAQGTTVYDIEEEILTGELRVGYHVQGFGDGDSGSFVNTPEPASGLLLGLGMLIFLKKSRNKP